MNKFIIINGSAGVGKDEVVKQCSIIKKNVFSLSTVDFVKQIAVLCGWNKEKNEKSRKFLSDLKDAMTNYDDIPTKKILERVKSLDNYVIFIHCREPDEVEKLRNLLDATTLLVKNKNVEKIETNHADREVENYDYDYIINNDGSIGDLIEECKEFLHWLGVNHEEI